MDPASRVQSELALAGGMGGGGVGVRQGASANPRILSRTPRMRLGSFAFPSVTMRSMRGMREVGGFGVSFLLSSLCEESFHSLGAQCLGISVH